MDTAVRALNFYSMEVTMCGYGSKSYELLLYGVRDVWIRQYEL